MKDDPVDLLEVIGRRYAFDTWRQSASPGRMFAWNVTFQGNEVPSMTAERVQRVELEPLRERAELPGGEAGARGARAWPTPAAHTQSIWRDESRDGVAIRVDTFEAGSTEEARELVLWLLGEFESPLIERKDSVGEVAFGAPGDHVLLFSRGNLVYLLRNIGRRPAPVLPAATALDAHASSPPETGRPVVPIAVRPAPDGSDSVEAVLLDVAKDGGAGPTQKFFAPAGEIWLTGGRVVYRGARAGLDEIVTYEARRPAAQGRQ